MASSTVPPPSNDAAAAAEPPSKSALKKAAKQAQAAANKAAKGVAAVASTSSNKDAAPAAGKKKEKAAPVEEGEPYPDVAEGTQKDLSRPMAAGYNPLAVESAWYSWWSTSGFFQPAVASKSPSEHSHFDPEPNFIPRDESSSANVDLSNLDRDKTFVIPSPPPNVTGSLHIGHALAFGLQDTLIRWYRMRGYTALHVPGFDHAGISTQSVVEKRLAKLEGLTRHDLGREKFLERCLTWKEDYQARITRQIERLGASTDWSRVAFTMNDDLSKAVADTFVKLHEDGIIYRANRLVHWCVQLNTTLSNLELENKELTGRTLLNVPGYDLKEKFEFGVLTSFAYPIDGSDETIVVATTRPETMLGDTAIAVHPDDPRHKHLHGKFAVHPFLEGKKIPIITDAIAVDMEFGTGAVKITPAHDPNDYECGMRNKLEFINILNDDGTFNDAAGPLFAGMKRFHARVKVIELLKERGLYIGQEDNAMSIPTCAKSGDIIESVMKPQWWVSCKSLAAAAIERTKAGELSIKPQQSEREWFTWLEGIQDWCISRQLWWGHRAPAYFVKMEGVEQDKLSGEFWVSGRTREEAQQKADVKFKGLAFTLEQDEDVLDTWFSSGLWPWSIQGWPKNTRDMELFYPSSLLETGWDILFFWVARMVMLGIYLTGKVPFNEVFCHAMIRDAHGRKMSKTLGNVIDPIDVIEGASLDSLHKQLLQGNLDEREVAKAQSGQKKDFPNGIPQCGTDALRFALAAYSSGGRDINLNILRVEGYRKFCNKLWNATKFAMLKLDGDFVPSPTAKPSGNESLVEKWILHKLNVASDSINKHLEERNFMLATADAYNFWLYEVCDVYIEAIKPITDAAAPAESRLSAQNTLYTVLDAGLRMLHPFMPYVTEELWQRLPRREGDKTKSIMFAKFPEKVDERVFATEEAQFDLAFEGIKGVRGTAASYSVLNNLQVFFLVRDPVLAEVFEREKAMLACLIKGCTSFKVVTSEADIPVGCAGQNIGKDLGVQLLLKGIVNADAEIAKAEKKRDAAAMSLDKLQKQMALPTYETKVAETQRQANTLRVETLEVEIATLATAIENFLKLKETE